MSSADFANFVARLNPSSASDARLATDAALLTRFVTGRDEEAFAALVRRHGGLVFGVCSRVTGDYHLAEDAFQAVFLVLARKATEVRPPGAVAAWLHGVAWRTAMRARTMADRRKRRETLAPVLPDRAALAPDTTPDAVTYLDDEIARLPERYRVPLVLCELQGHSRKEVAAQLRIPEGTLSSRLAHTRKLLAARLRERGLTLSITAVGVALARAATAAPSTRLVTRAVLSATRELASPSVASLTQGVLRIMFLTRLKIALALATMALGLLVCATVAAVQPPVATPTTPPLPRAEVAKPADPARTEAEPVPLPKGPNKLLFFRGFYRAGPLLMIDPDGTNEQKVRDDEAKLRSGYARLSPDGKELAVVIQTYDDNGVPDDGRKLYVRKLTEKDPGTDLEVSCQYFAWSPDGDYLATTEHPYLVKGDRLRTSHTLVNVKTKEKKPLKLPDHHVITDWTPDGKHLLTHAMPTRDKPSCTLQLMNLDGTEHKALAEDARIPGGNATRVEFRTGGRISPDGTRVLYSFSPLVKSNADRDRDELRIQDVATGKITKVTEFPFGSRMGSCCWSPDGKRIAYTWLEILGDKRAFDIEPQLVICDTDGKTRKTIVSERVQPNASQWGPAFHQVDWR